VSAEARNGSMSKEEGDKRVKLTGYEWFRSIGSPKKIVAPMVDQSDLAYRLLCRRHGADLAYTQMLNCPIFLNNPQYRFDNIGPQNQNERPLTVQIAGHDPQAMLKVGLAVQDECDAVDVNLGCPQGIARRGRYGAYLMEELELLHEIVSTLAQGLSVPVTCKTRIYHGEDGFERSIRLCETLVNAGASLLTIHGRTREEKGEWTGAADWEMIRRIKEHFGDRVPIIANGGISDMDDVTKCLEYTKCDGVMSSEAILENPAIFSRSLAPDGTRLTQIMLAREYLDLAEIHPTRNPKIVRSHINKMLHRYLAQFTDLRDKFQVTYELKDFRKIVDDVEERLAALPPDEVAAFDTKERTWYGRHLQATHSCSGRVMGMERKIMMDKRFKEQAEKDWKLFEEDGEEEDENWGGIFSGLGMAL